MLVGAASGAVGQLASNALEGKPLGDGVLAAGQVGGRVVGKLLGSAVKDVTGGADAAAEEVATDVADAGETLYRQGVNQAEREGGVLSDEEALQQSAGAAMAKSSNLWSPQIARR